jgi:hypothetical protein
MSPAEQLAADPAQLPQWVSSSTQDGSLDRHWGGYFSSEAPSLKSPQGELVPRDMHANYSSWATILARHSNVQSDIPSLTYGQGPIPQSPGVVGMLPDQQTKNVKKDRMKKLVEGTEESSHAELSKSAEKSADRYKESNEYKLKSHYKSTGQHITTMMLCDMPCRLKQHDLISTLNAEGFADTYSYVHVPRRASSSLGYAFVDFIDPASASRFAEVFDGYRFPNTQSSKVCSVKMGSERAYTPAWLRKRLKRVPLEL